jgi:4'-phosphopantetheinyl transferase
MSTCFFSYFNRNIPLIHAFPLHMANYDMQNIILNLSKKGKSLPIYGNQIILNSKVHLWLFEMKKICNSLDVCFDILTFDEQEKTKRFYFEEDKKRAIFSRSLLRILLTKYLYSITSQYYSPKNISFEYGKEGKPFLKECSFLHFNLSHSKTVLLYAFSSYPIGVDIEYIQDLSNLNELKKWVLSKEEISKPINLKEFYAIWTQKEAYLKGIGKGLSFSMTNIEIIDCLEGDNAEWCKPKIKIKKDFFDQDSWIICPFKYGDAYCGAVSIPLANRFSSGSVKSSIHFF